jgi:AraC family transcriptional regulator
MARHELYSRRRGGSPVRCHDPLAAALAQKTQMGAPGTADHRMLASGKGWHVLDVVCTCGPDDHPYEEATSWASVALVLSGSFVCRSEAGIRLLAPGSLFLLNPGQAFECSHAHGSGDRCLAFQYEPALFERLAHEAGGCGAKFKNHRLPPLRALAQATARAQLGLAHAETLEETALELAGAAIQIANDKRLDAPVPTQHQERITRTLRRLGTHIDQRHALADLAKLANMSPYHFLRTFKAVTGVTPHQWLLRARLRDAARRLSETREPVTGIALQTGFEDLSNFIRSFRAEFGLSPQRYRAVA